MSERPTQSEAQWRDSVRDLARFGGTVSEAHLRSNEEYERDCAAEGRTPPRALRVRRFQPLPVIGVRPALAVPGQESVTAARLG